MNMVTHQKKYASSKMKKNEGVNYSEFIKPTNFFPKGRYIFFKTPVISILLTISY